MLEIGVNTGGSIRLWRDLFPQAKIYAGDIRPYNAIAGVHCIVGDMYDKHTASIFASGSFDLIIDNGPHTLESFIRLLAIYYKKLTLGGYLIIEDVLYREWVDIIEILATSIGFRSIAVYDMRGKQKTPHLLECWNSGLYVVKLRR